MDGVLLKKTRNGKWNSRQFAIENGALVWVKSDNKSQIRVPLVKGEDNDGDEVLNVEIRDVKFGLKAYAFEVTVVTKSSSRVVSLAAASASEKAEWMAALEEAAMLPLSQDPNAVVEKEEPVATPRAKLQMSKRALVKGRSAMLQTSDTQLKDKVGGLNQILGLVGAAERPEGEELTSAEKVAQQRLKEKLTGKISIPVSNRTICGHCNKTVYKMEEVLVDNMPFHKGCFRCEHCNRQLTLSNFAAVNKKLYCKTHYIELFKNSGGKYDVFGDAGFKQNSRSSSAAKGVTPKRVSQPQSSTPSTVVVASDPDTTDNGVKQQPTTQQVVTDDGEGVEEEKPLSPSQVLRRERQSKKMSLKAIRAETETIPDSTNLNNRQSVGLSNSLNQRTSVSKKHVSRRSSSQGEETVEEQKGKETSRKGSSGGPASKRSSKSRVNTVDGSVSRRSTSGSKILENNDDDQHRASRRESKDERESKSKRLSKERPRSKRESKRLSKQLENVEAPQGINASEVKRESVSRRTSNSVHSVRNNSVHGQDLGYDDELPLQQVSHDAVSDTDYIDDDDLGEEVVPVSHETEPPARGSIEHAPPSGEEPPNEANSDARSTSLEHLVLERPRGPKKNVKKSVAKVGKVLNNVGSKDKAKHERTFVFVPDVKGPSLVCHASSLAEKTRWMTVLANVIQLCKLEDELVVAQKKDMMKSLQAGMLLDAFKQQNEFSYTGYLEKLAMKSHKNWKKRFFVVENRELRYQVSEKSRKVKNVLKVTSNCRVTDASGVEFHAEIPDTVDIANMLPGM